MPILDDARKTGHDTSHEKKRPWMPIALTVAIVSIFVGLAALVLHFTGAV